MEVAVNPAASLLTDFPSKFQVFLLQVGELRLREGPTANEQYQQKPDSELHILSCCVTKEAMLPSSLLTNMLWVCNYKGVMLHPK